MTARKPGGTARPELCGCWIQAGCYETVCMLPMAHTGVCVPLRSELMQQLDRWDAQGAELTEYITALDDQANAWPYEGPEDERPSRGTAKKGAT